MSFIRCYSELKIHSPYSKKSSIFFCYRFFKLPLTETPGAYKSKKVIVQWRGLGWPFSSAATWCHCWRVTYTVLRTRLAEILAQAMEDSKAGDFTLHSRLPLRYLLAQEHFLRTGSSICPLMHSTIFLCHEIHATARLGYQNTTGILLFMFSFCIMLIFTLCWLSLTDYMQNGSKNSTS